MEKDTRVSLLRAGFPEPMWVDLVSGSHCPNYANEVHRSLYGACCLGDTIPVICTRTHPSRQLKCGKETKFDWRDGCFSHEYSIDKSTFPDDAGDLVNIVVTVKGMEEVESENLGRKTNGAFRYDGLYDLTKAADSYVVDIGVQTMLQGSPEDYSLAKYSGTNRRIQSIEPIQVEVNIPRESSNYIKIFDLDTSNPDWYHVHVGCAAAPDSREDIVDPHPAPLPDTTTVTTRSGERVWCPIGSYASDFSLKADYGCAWGGDCSGITQVIFGCSSIGEMAYAMPDNVPGLSYYIKSPSDQQWDDDINDGVEISGASCEGGSSYLRGFKMRQDSEQSWKSDAQGLSELEFTCTDNKIKPQSTSDWEGYWSNYFMCPEGSCICGMNTEYEKYCGGTCDDSGVTYIQVYCCYCEVDFPPEQIPEMEPFDASKFEPVVLGRKITDILDIQLPIANVKNDGVLFNTNQLFVAVIIITVMIGIIALLYYFCLARSRGIKNTHVFVGDVSDIDSRANDNERRELI